MKRVAFFGLGAMGMPMARNLLGAGYEISTCFHPSQDMSLVSELLTMERFRTFSTNHDAARGVDVVVTMLPADAQVKALLMDDGFAAVLGPGAVIVEMSSCTTGAVKEVEVYYRGRDIPVVDAPVSGGVAGAVGGTLTIFASGESGAVAKVRPLFELMGKTIFELGPCGEGKAYKNLNNLLLAVNLLAATEAFHIAQKQGIDLERFYDVVCASSGGSRALKDRWPKMVGRAFEGGFKQALGRKDLGNALALAEGIPVPLAKLTYELMLANRENDDLDLSAMCKLFEE